MPVTKFMRWATVLSLMALGASARPNIVQNHSFEDGTYTNGWTASNCEPLGSFVVAQDGGQCVDLTGSAPGSIAQLLNTTPGQFYSLDFFLAANLYGGSAFRQVDVLWDGALAGTFTYDGTGEIKSSPRWDAHAIPALLATGASTELKFVDSSGSNNTLNLFGASIDNVSVNSVPAPATLAVCPIAAALLGRRRRD